MTLASMCGTLREPGGDVETVLKIDKRIPMLLGQLTLLLGTPECVTATCGQTQTRVCASDVVLRLLLLLKCGR
jgi:hypothetical protein